MHHEVPAYQVWLLSLSPTSILPPFQSVVQYVPVTSLILLLLYSDFSLFSP